MIVKEAEWMSEADGMSEWTGEWEINYDESDDYCNNQEGDNVN